ncbi:ATP-binding cassette domain-containing protein [Streptomyces iconiensis]|uniref:ATP-binding cassette domain-containing protein n=1 Tax=Streptomyces iconiensis TaxID=1384038 RepID=A0ABT7A637_9ACTN|nr:ATP-binding cassette domain-containing protein [Streptomyces iconiensis]MDJ1136756.1 ATP-binding cassette domain-containing protein [Streptomyces iconiensis]
MTVELALEGARVHYGPLEALHGVDLAVPAGHLTVLLGRNGSGRTTALRALAGTVRLTAGRVRRRGADVSRTPAHVRARDGLVFVPDRQAVFGTLTVAENVELAARSPVPPRQLPYPALRSLLARTAGTLSGGELRMLAVTRALLSPARVLLLDEPTQGMAPAAVARTYELLGEAVRAEARTVLLAEQRLEPGLRAATTVVHELRRGAVAFSGEPHETLPPRQAG